jgi:hypothetical protein
MRSGRVAKNESHDWDRCGQHRGTEARGVTGAEPGADAEPHHENPALLVGRVVSFFAVQVVGQSLSMPGTVPGRPDER